MLASLERQDLMIHGGAPRYWQGSTLEVWDVFVLTGMTPPMTEWNKESRITGLWKCCLSGISRATHNLLIGDSQIESSLNHTSVCVFVRKNTVHGVRWEHRCNINTNVSPIASLLDR